MSLKLSRRQTEVKAWLPTMMGTTLSALFLYLSFITRDEGFCGSLHQLCLSLPPAFALFFSTGTYFTARSSIQEEIIAFTATVVSATILATFSEESKHIPFLAATKQFSMVLLAGAVTLLFRSTLSNPKWQQAHTPVSVTFATIAFAYPFLAELYRWPHREGLSDVTAIFAAATFGSIYLKEKAEKRAGRRN